LVTTPVHLRALVESRIPLPQVESIVVASAPLSLSLAKRAEEVFATTVIDLYGCTEAGTIATRQPTRGSAWTPCAGIALRATDAGCVVSGPHLPRPVVVNDAIDVMLDGTFFLHGRSDDQIKIAGRRTSLSALNSILTGVEGVLDGTFAAVPTLHDPERSRLIAFVVSPGLTAAQVTAALQNNLDPALLPHQVHLVAALPRLPTGKLPVAKLAELVASATEAHGRG
jgi:acyl-coenzyme A synthetase/AMP-(fatty) acid ligase